VTVTEKYLETGGALVGVPAATSSPFARPRRPAVAWREAKKGPGARDALDGQLPGFSPV
jgi:hypothetical protein